MPRYDISITVDGTDDSLLVQVEAGSQEAAERRVGMFLQRVRSDALKSALIVGAREAQ